MANETRKDQPATDAHGAWQRPTLKYVGSVNDVFLFPGEGKISLPSDDMGDAPLKPKGQE